MSVVLHQAHKPLWTTTVLAVSRGVPVRDMNEFFKVLVAEPRFTYLPMSLCIKQDTLDFCPFEDCVDLKRFRSFQKGMAQSDYYKIRDDIRLQVTGCPYWHPDEGPVIGIASPDDVQRTVL